MSISTPNKFPVVLESEERERLEELTRNGHAPAKKILHAQVLLLSDRNRPDGRRTRSEIASLLNMHVNTVDKIRKRFSEEGERPALERKPRAEPPVQPLLDGHAEARLIALCCGDAPPGRTRWTLQLLADELMKRRIVTRISAETVRRKLKKTSCSLGVNAAGAFPKETRRGSSPRWKKCSTSTPRSTPTKSR